jgi:riboflavin kinase / FMN adenylyltransferase
VGIKVYTRDNLPSGRPCAALAIGTFDGVHRGHLHILKALTDLAREEGSKAMLVMFDFPPALFFNPELPRELLTLPHERIPYLERAGVQIVYELQFDKRIALMKAREFLDSVNTTFDITGLLVGHDHLIGSDRLVKDEDFLPITREVGIGFKRVGRKKYGAWTAASSLVRRMIREARLRAVSALLGRFHSVTGEVLEGERIGGSTLACPTANVLLPQFKLSPPSGVYAGIAHVLNSVNRQVESSHEAAINIMPSRVKHVYMNEPPDRMLIEAHLLDFDGDLYGKMIEIEFVRRIRPELSFSNMASLKRQIAIDVEQIREMKPSTVTVPTEAAVRTVLDEDAVE